MKALVVGGTGLTGSLVIERLLKSSDFSEVISLVRKNSGQKHPKLIEVICDFSSESFFNEWNGITHVFCCIGTTIKKAGTQEAFKQVDFEIPLKVAQKASSYPIHFLIITALGSNANSSIFYNRVKGQLEVELKKLPLEQLSILQPSLILGKRNESRVGEQIGQILAPFLNLVLIGPLKTFRAIKAEYIANAMVKLALRKEFGAKTYVSSEIAALGKN